MTLFYINIDDFVGIKKRFGIEEANKLLISLATRLKKNCRTVDVIARFHADEFIILCPQTGPDSAMTILHRLQEVLDRFINESNGSVNANIGALTYLVCPASVELIIERLETIMHALKRGGTAGTVHQVIESN